jgi:DNA polymerase V
MTQYELKGQPCIPLVTEPPIPKSIQVSRTWGSVIESLEDLERAIIDNVLKAGTLLRRDHLAATAMSVYARYGYRHYGECGYITNDVSFEDGVKSDMEMIQTAREILRKIYCPGQRYTQGGVILCYFTDANYRQQKLFDENREWKIKCEKFSSVTDAINKHLGGRAIYPATLAVQNKPWRPHREHLSPGCVKCD